MDKEKNRRIMIGTPTIDGRVDQEYLFSMIDTIVYMSGFNIQVFPLIIAYDTLIQRARNDIIMYAVQNNIDDLIFIDSDMGWEPDFVKKLLDHNVDMVGGTTRRKTDEEAYVVKLKDKNLIPDKNGLIEVEGLGTGFLRLSKRCFRLLWEKSEKYTEDNNKESRMVFNVTIKDGSFISEDISLCHKWTDLDEKIWFDPTITCSHIGIKRYTGNFENWIKNIKI
jgi:hypothetical protein